jgi:hypothetical protein
MILINGCSFTEIENTWVDELQKKKPAAYIKNVATSGASNTLIRRKIYYYLNNMKKENTMKYAIIQWTTIDRWDYPIFVDEEKSKTFSRMDMHPERINKINYMCNGTDTFGYGKDFYEKYYSIYGAVIETLENIYHTQQYLESVGVPYKMITIGNLFDIDASMEKLIELQTTNVALQKGNYANLKTQKNIIDKLEDYENSWYEVNNIKSLLNKIDFTKFLFTDNVNIYGFGGGIIEWFLNKNEKLIGGGGHPSKEQHQNFFEEFLWDKIKNEIDAVT